MIRIIADSTCDINAEEQKNLGIEVLPLSITFGQKVYKDGIDLSHSQFYRLLEKSTKLPTTSQINPGEFSMYFKKYMENGDDVIGIFLSSELSGTFQSARIAANAINPEHIFTIDSGTGSFGTALLIKEAVRLRDSGEYTAAEIVTKIQRLVSRLRIYAVVDTLKYLKMGGRIGTYTNIIGTALKICPIVEVYCGKLAVVSKSRGEKGGFNELLKQLNNYSVDYSYGVAFGHSDSPERLQRCVEFLKPHLQTNDIYIGSLGSVIGTHTGPGVVGIAFIEKEEK